MLSNLVVNSLLLQIKLLVCQTKMSSFFLSLFSSRTLFWTLVSSLSLMVGCLDWEFAYFWEKIPNCRPDQSTRFDVKFFATFWDVFALLCFVLTLTSQCFQFNFFFLQCGRSHTNFPALPPFRGFC